MLRKIRNVAIALMAALAALLLVPGSASATTYWPDVSITAHLPLSRTGDRQCLFNDGNTYTVDLEAHPLCTDLYGSPYYTTWQIKSVAPDQGRPPYSMVQIKNVLTNRCLQVYSGQLQAKSCDSSNPYQIWALTWSQQQMGWQFFNFPTYMCMDGGQGSLLYHESGCNSGNAYQTWDTPTEN
jgi:hypothetical protein